MSLYGVTVAIDNTELIIRSVSSQVFSFSTNDNPFKIIFKSREEDSEEESAAVKAVKAVDMVMDQFCESQKSEASLKKANLKSQYTVDKSSTICVVHYNPMTGNSNVSKYDDENKTVTELGPCNEEIASFISDAVKFAMGDNYVDCCKENHITGFDFTLKSTVIPVVGADAAAGIE
jgi:hypothetical protein